MRKETIDKLLALNRDFYATFAEHFAATRSISDPALTAILPHLPRRGCILDVGCGNGRLALLLDQERPGSTYVGLDAVPALIQVARAQLGCLSEISASFHVADVAHPGWTSGFPNASFDCVVLLAVLHHIPSSGLRARILHDLVDLLTLDGCVIISTWRFLSSERIRRKIVPWTEVEIEEENLEPGDYLLDWKRGGRGLRYCHMVDEAEVGRLAAASGLLLRETFRAGGREGDLSLFAVLDRDVDG